KAIPARPRAPGRSTAQATGVEVRVAAGAERAVEPATVARTIELVTGVVLLGRISKFSGVKVQVAWSGKPEQDKVTNIGAESDAALIGVIEAVTEPDRPAVSESVAGATG